MEIGKALGEGHVFDSTTISGGNVHLGDSYYVTYRKDSSSEDSPTSSSARTRRTGPGIRKAIKSERHYIVPRNSTPQFTGRNFQLGQIKKCFFQPKSAVPEDRPKVVVLVGLGGSGKTQVALRYAEINQNLYSGVFWIDASSKTSAEAAYASIGQQFGVGPTWTAGKHALSQLPQQWLLILDNVDDSQADPKDDSQMDINNYLPSGKVGHILITTRKHDTFVYANAGRIQFGKMDPEEAIQLLLKSAYADTWANNDDMEHRTAAEQIASALGYLAIAVSQAGVTIRRKICTIEEYLQFYLGSRTRLSKSRSEKCKQDILGFATWDIPFKQIEEQSTEECRDAVVLMCMFALLHFESIPKALLESPWTPEAKRSPWVNQLPDLFRAESKLRLRRAMSMLADCSLVDEEPKIDAYSLHPVVHEWAQFRIDGRDNTASWLEPTLCLLSCCRAETFTAAKGMSILPHLDYCLAVVKDTAPEILQTKQGMYEAEVFASMYAANGAWKKSIDLLETILKCRMRTQGWRHEDTLTTQRSLSLSYWSEFRVGDAIAVQEQIRLARWWLRSSLFDWVHVLYPSHLSYLLALNDLTQTLWLGGLRTLSRRTGRRAVQGLSEQLGDKDLRTVDAKFNLGRTYLSTGELEEGHKLVRSVVYARRALLGPEHPDTLTAENEFGMSFWARKKHLPLSYKLVRRVWNDRIRILGRDHPYTLWSANDLSKILCELERFDEAIELLKEVIPMIEQAFDATHIGMHVTKGNLARAYAMAKDWEQADRVASDVYASIDKTHPDWFQHTYGSARIKTEVGQIEVAEEMCQDMIDMVIYEGPKSFRFRTAMELLANIYLQGSQKAKLEDVREENPWMTDDHVQNPPSVVTLSMYI